MRITTEMNERLTRVGAGTPMGEVFRSYWIPAVLAADIASPDSPPVRVRLLGEDLVAFRDSAGDVGLLDAYCPHRRAPLFFGRNEECGLRCVYHGWKFDVHGNCVDAPSEPPESQFRFRVGTLSYPTHEAGGIVWTYMGPVDRMPEPPDYEWMRAPSTHRGVSQANEPCNYLQAVEGGIDTAHSSFAHNNDLSNTSHLRALDTHPRLEVDVTGHGFTYASLRRVGGGRIYLRTYQFAMPSTQIRGGLITWQGEPASYPVLHGHIWVPIDDENTAVYNFAHSADPGQPMEPGWFEEHEDEMGRGPRHFADGTHWLVRHPGNDYLIDREVQRTQTFTGVEGVNTQDYAIQTGMGRIVDRSKEALGSTDLAISTARRLLLEAADEVAEGRPARGSDPASHRGVRAGDILMDATQDWREMSKDVREARF
ncbi:Rieske 2Fe-2S domain-containing protein [Streptomyces sp. NBC_01754]|uniref:Rieske 2Fe-2S domain-containing protein n=1 Tax=Streptomyces sp. NBC_01754 TaxID=2975930 RepID=UPI002DD8D7FE|nr:Rieske 2Fe-2S domain-containing protein [Streptomyces sp. NBC_01754]WSC96389.1 Rieske 2Fe-2S domain-containing protein [Streptomyces sp. NBC_01754]